MGVESGESAGHVLGRTKAQRPAQVIQEDLSVALLQQRCLLHGQRRLVVRLGEQTGPALQLGHAFHQQQAGAI